VLENFGTEAHVNIARGTIIEKRKISGAESLGYYKL
jgi:hypothetical protein